MVPAIKMKKQNTKSTPELNICLPDIFLQMLYILKMENTLISDVALAKVMDFLPQSQAIYHYINI